MSMSLNIEIDERGDIRWISIHPLQIDFANGME